MAAPTVHGVVVIDKPRGPTSHDVVRDVRRALGTHAVGHAGTLDPMATGVLVVAVGEATKLLAWLTADDKSYDARIAFGRATDTLDAEGITTSERPCPPELAAACAAADPEATILGAALDLERARSSQIPPAFSAIKVGGVSSHDRARRGEAIVLPPRPVRVIDLRPTGGSANPPCLDVSITAAKGYYVRSLARDLAIALGTDGHLAALRRTRSGSFSLDDAIPPADVSPDRLLSSSVAARRALPAVTLDDAAARAARCGKEVPLPDTCIIHVPTAWLDASGTLVAVGAATSPGRGRVIRGFQATS